MKSTFDMNFFVHAEEEECFSFSLFLFFLCICDHFKGHFASFYSSRVQKYATRNIS